MKVVVASGNQVKISAARQGFLKMFPGRDFVFEGRSVPSNVSGQPMTDSETLKGALNRAENAMRFEADFWVGIEGGVEKAGKELRAFAWVVIKSKEKTGKARTATFYLPEKVAKLIDDGRELGEADDIVFGKENSKQKNGAVGILTGDAIDRAGLYAEAVVLALIPFRNQGMY